MQDQNGSNEWKESRNEGKMQWKKIEMNKGMKAKNGLNELMNEWKWNKKIQTDWKNDLEIKLE